MKVTMAVLLTAIFMSACAASNGWHYQTIWTAPTPYDNRTFVVCEQNNVTGELRHCL